MFGCACFSLEVYLQGLCMARQSGIYLRDSHSTNAKKKNGPLHKHAALPAMHSSILKRKRQALQI